jgi:hypothetical protein
MSRKFPNDRLKDSKVFAFSEFLPIFSLPVQRVKGTVQRDLTGVKSGIN